MAAAGLTDPGIIALSKNGSMMTTHFRLDLFAPDGILLINSGDVTLSGGFIGSLAAAIGVDPTLQINLGGGASMDVIADVDELLAIAQALTTWDLTLDDLFPGAGGVSIIIDEPDPSKFALLADIAIPELLDYVTEVTPPTDGGAIIHLPLSIVGPGSDLYDDLLLYDEIIIIGTAAEIQDFRTQGSGDFNVPTAVLDLVSEYQITTGNLTLDAQVFNDEDTVFTPLGDDETMTFAQLLVQGEAADFDGGLGLDSQITLGAPYGTADVLVQDSAANITANAGALGATIETIPAFYVHTVEAPGDAITTFSGVSDYIFFESGALVADTTYVLFGDFDVNLDLLDISEATGVISYDEMNPVADFSFIGDTQDFNNHDFALDEIGETGENDKDRIDIRLFPGSTDIEFDGLTDAYDGTKDFTIVVPNDVLGTLDVRDFFGIPANDRITFNDFEDSILIPDLDLMRFDDLTLVDNSLDLSTFQSDKLYNPTPRHGLVLNVESTDGDFLIGTAGIDTLLGDGANPFFNDVLFGDAGADILQGGLGNDFVSGDLGNDILDGGAGIDTIEGGTGDDIIMGNDGDDSIVGDNFFAVVNGETDNDTIHGGAGNDEIFGSWDIDAIIAPGLDDDLIYGDAGDDSIFASNGNDTIYGGIGDDDLYGQFGDDYSYGEDGDDEFYPDIGDDYSSGGAGNDQIFDEDGNDTLEGGDGNDWLDGGNDDDTVSGGDGDDLVEGGNGDDMVYGDDGVDDLDGNDGNDMLVGGEGIDVLRGGAGDDIFSFFLLNGLGDTILDFIAPTTSYSPVVDKLALDLGIWRTDGSDAIFHSVFQTTSTFTTGTESSSYTSVALPHVNFGADHIHVLNFSTTIGRRMDWRTASATLNNVPLVADFDLSGSNVKTAFRTFLTAQSATIEERGFVTNPFTTKVVTHSGTQTFFGSTLTGPSWTDGTGVFVAFGRVNSHLLMATVRNAGPLSITAAEVGTIHTVAIFNGDPSTIPALLTDTIILV